MNDLLGAPVAYAAIESTVQQKSDCSLQFQGNMLIMVYRNADRQYANENQGGGRCLHGSRRNRRVLDEFREIYGSGYQ